MIGMVAAVLLAIAPIHGLVLESLPDGTAIVRTDAVTRHAAVTDAAVSLIAGDRVCARHSDRCIARHVDYVSPSCASLSPRQPSPPACRNRGALSPFAWAIEFPRRC